MVVVVVAAATASEVSKLADYKLFRRKAARGTRITICQVGSCGCPDGRNSTTRKMAFKRFSLSLTHFCCCFRMSARNAVREIMIDSTFLCKLMRRTKLETISGKGEIKSRPTSSSLETAFWWNLIFLFRSRRKKTKKARTAKQQSSRAAEIRWRLQQRESMEEDHRILRTAAAAVFLVVEHHRPLQWLC